MTGAKGTGVNVAPTRSIGRVEVVEGAVLDDGRDLRAEAHADDRLVGDDAAVGLAHGADDRVLVERQERARVDDLDGDALGLGLLRRRERLVDEPAGGDDGHVLALAVHARLADLDALDLVRHLVLQVVEGAVLEEDDGVVVVDRAPEEPARVGGGRGEHDLDPGDVHEPRLQLLRVLRAGRPAGAALRSQRHGHLDLASGHVAVLGGLLDELLHRQRHEVLVHDLDDRAHAGDGRADAGSDDRHLGDRRVAHALGPELVEHPLRDAHRAAHLGDVLAHDEDVVVAAHRLAHRVAHGLPVGHRRHQA